MGLRRPGICIAIFSIFLYLIGCAPSVDQLTGLPPISQRKPPPQLAGTPSPPSPNAPTAPASYATTPRTAPQTGARAHPALTISRGWQRGVAAYNQAMAMSRSKGMPVIVLHYRPGCPYCAALERQYLSNPKFQQAVSGYLLVALNTRGTPAEARVADQNRVTGTPTIHVYPGGGKSFREVIVFYRQGGRIMRKSMNRLIADISRAARPGA